MRLGNILDIEFGVMNVCIMNHRVWISVLYFFWYSVHSYSLLGNLWWGFQNMVTKMFICNMSYSVKKKKTQLVHTTALRICKKLKLWNPNWPVSQYERPRAVALASSACVDKTTKIITEFTRKDPFLHQKQAN